MTARMGIGGGVGIFGSMSSANDRIKIDSSERFTV